MSKQTVNSMAASASSGKPAAAGCTDCETLPDVQAVILYPSLGSPLVLAPGQTRCSIIIASNEKMGAAKAKASMPFKRKPSNLFVDTGTGDAFGGYSISDPLAGFGIAPVEPTFLYRAVDRHLRLAKISEKKTADDTTQGTLFNDGKTYSKAKSAVKGKYLGLIGQSDPFLTRDETGAIDMVFSLSPHAVTLYQDYQYVFQVTLDLEAQPFKSISDGEFMSFAWMVKQAKPSDELPGTHAHCNDLAIAKFRKTQTDHFAKWQEFDIASPVREGMPGQRAAKENSIWSWHPVIRSKATKQLKLGHLSDVHVNIRQNVLAQSKASVLEGAPGAQPVGSKVANCLESLKNLFDQFGSGPTKADALVITGDLIDFNRNLCPAQAQGNIAAQWKAFNVINNVENQALYPRGQDDMLMFSLVRYAYTDLKLPVFMTTGNHEAYQVPYGISPRVKVWRDAVGRGRSESSGLHFKEAVKNMTLEDKVALNDHSDRKANSGIAADHNMTIFEAALAYGPTYAQVVLTENFNNTQFDWFYALFTPLNNWCIYYGDSPSSARQALVGLGWGDAENYKNAGNLNPLDSDNQGVGILPRSVDGITEAQKQILAAAQTRKAKGKASSVSVFSHFTLINYGGSLPLFTDKSTTNTASLPVKDGAFETCNTGTFQKNQKWYLQDCVNAQGKAVDYHFSGHSHRAGVYQGEIEVNRVLADNFKVTLALEPTTQAASLGARGITALIVSSCGGPVGVQNFANELCDGTDGWTLRPASGTLVDPNEHKVQRVAVNTQLVPSAKPRLCVALDYLHLGDSSTLRFAPQFQRTADLTKAWKLQLGKKLKALDCIEKVWFWVFQSGGTDQSTATRGGVKKKGWVKLTPTYAGESVTFTDADMAILKAATQSAYDRRVVSPMFAEITLKQPNNLQLKTNLWAADMNCTDPWVFPVQIAVNYVGNGMNYQHVLERPAGKDGEIPMWEWLSDAYKYKYPTRRSITGTSNT